MADFVKLVLTVLLVMDPVGIVPQYMALSSSMTEENKRFIIKKAVCIAACVLFIFILLGRFLLIFFGITPGAFYVAGGLLFFLISFEMIYSNPRSRQTPSDDSPHGASLAALFPLAVPLIAGPGLITTIMIFVTAEARPWIVSVALVIPAVAVGLAAVYSTLRFSFVLFRLIGTTGMFVLEKIMGLILSGLSVQLMYEGLVKLHIISGA